MKFPALLVATLIAFSALLPVGGFAADEAIGRPAADFTLKSTTGKNVRLAEQKGDVVMVNFWATWCGPCRQEMPLLEKINQKYKDLGFVLLGINVEEDTSGMSKYLKDVLVTFPILNDGKNAVAKLYGVDGMPSTVIIDRNGVVRFIHRGYKPGYEQKYEQQIKQLVME